MQNLYNKSEELSIFNTTLQIIINNCPMGCNNEQSIYLLQGHSACFGCRRTHHQEYTKL